MTNDSETVREVCAEIKKMIVIRPDISGGYDRENIVDRVISAYEREMASVIAERDAEIRRRALLERALKPVMECDMSVRGYGVRIENAVREAQRIMKEFTDGESHN